MRFDNSAERGSGEQRHKSSASQTRWEVQNKEVQVIPEDRDDGEPALLQVIPKDLDNGEGDVWADHGRVSNGTQVAGADTGTVLYIFRWTESLKKVLKKGLKKVTQLKKVLKKVMKLKKKD